MLLRFPTDIRAKTEDILFIVLKNIINTELIRSAMLTRTFILGTSITSFQINVLVEVETKYLGDVS